MKILVDTNVLISAFVFGGRTKEVLLELMDSRHEVFITTYIQNEFEKKISEKWGEHMDKILQKFHQIGFDIRESTEQIEQIIRDVKDDPILADARHYGVDILLTGDKDFLEAGIENPKICSPAMIRDYDLAECFREVPSAGPK